MRATMRKTEKSVNREAVEGLWKKLFTLWVANPLGFVDFVAHSRSRSCEIVNQLTVRQLLQLGLVDSRQRLPVHDAIRELVATCVEGEGITTMLYRPFAGEDTPISVTSTLLSGQKATHHIAAMAHACLEKLMEADYMAFVEYVRLVRDNKDPSNLYGNTLETLNAMGVVHLRFEGNEEQEAYHALMQEAFGGRLLVDGPMKLVRNKVLDTVLLEVTEGERGLDFSVKSSPFKESHATGDQGNGRAHGHSTSKTPKPGCAPRSTHSNN